MYAWQCLYCIWQYSMNMNSRERERAIDFMREKENKPEWKVLFDCTLYNVDRHDNVDDDDDDDAADNNIVVIQNEQQFVYIALYQSMMYVTFLQLWERERKKNNWVCNVCKRVLVFPITSHFCLFTCAIDSCTHWKKKYCVEMQTLPFHVFLLSYELMPMCA